MTSAHEWLLAAPLLLSLISSSAAGASELQDSMQVAENPMQFSARHPIGLTARLEEMVPLAAETPRGRGADAWVRRSREDSIATQEDDTGWRVGGALVGALMVGVPMGVAAQALNGSSGVGIAVGLAGGLAGGVCGHYLGTLARDGGSGTGSRSATFKVLNVVVRVAAVAIAASFKLNLSPMPVY